MNYFTINHTINHWDISIFLLNSSYALICACTYNTDTLLVIYKTECQKSNELIILMGESCTFVKDNKTIQQMIDS